MFMFNYTLHIWNPDCIQISRSWRDLNIIQITDYGASAESGENSGGGALLQTKFQRKLQLTVSIVNLLPVSLTSPHNWSLLLMNFGLDGNNYKLNIHPKCQASIQEGSNLFFHLVSQFEPRGTGQWGFPTPPWPPAYVGIVEKEPGVSSLPPVSLPRSWEAWGYDMFKAFPTEII